MRVGGPEQGLRHAPVCSLRATPSLPLRKGHHSRFRRLSHDDGDDHRRRCRANHGRRSKRKAMTDQHRRYTRVMHRGCCQRSPGEGQQQASFAAADRGVGWPSAMASGIVDLHSTPHELDQGRRLSDEELRGVMLSATATKSNVLSSPRSELTFSGIDFVLTQRGTCA